MHVPAPLATLQSTPGFSVHVVTGSVTDAVQLSSTSSRPPHVACSAVHQEAHTRTSEAPVSVNASCSAWHSTPQCASSISE